MYVPMQNNSYRILLFWSTSSYKVNITNIFYLYKIYIKSSENNFNLNITENNTTLYKYNFFYEIIRRTKV